MLAIFDNLGFTELLIVVVAAVLVFGKRLPEVAAQAGQQIGKFRRSLQDVKNETGIDEDIRKIQRDIQNVVPRDLSMGEMARIASAELEKRMKATEEPKAPEPQARASDAQVNASDPHVKAPDVSGTESSTHSAQAHSSNTSAPEPHGASTHHIAPTDPSQPDASVDSNAHDSGGHAAHGS